MKPQPRWDAKVLGMTAGQYIWSIRCDEATVAETLNADVARDIVDGMNLATQHKLAGKP